jgi:endonuclease YncB( thermonuclease family)
VVLIGILVAIFVKEGLGLDVLWASSPPAVSGGGPFMLCSHGTQVQCVVDGDTIHYAGLKIRLEDIDAPETYQYKCASELALGQRATNRLLELINAGPFELVNRGDRDEDRYGRKLRTIERNGRSLGEILVAEGLARRWDGARRSWCSEVR